ncbi:hypothetical protein SCUP515_06556 [Seiridium cupressi]
MCMETINAYSLRRSDTVYGADESTPSSTSDIDYSLEYLKIHLQLNMGDHLYMQQSSSHRNRDSISAPSTLPVRALSISPPATVACTTPDPATTYSSIAPFSYSLSYDSSLPTPVSVAGSPSMPDRSSIKMAHSFSNTGNHSQQPRPHGTSRPGTSEWFRNPQNTSMIRSAQPPASSSMTLDPNTDLRTLHGLENTHSPPHQSIPMTSAEHYWGSYSVSTQGPQDDMSPRMTSTALFSNLPQDTPHVNPSALLKNYPLASNSQMPLAPAPHVPMLSSTPNPGGLAAPITPIENLNHHNPFALGHAPLIVGLQPTYKRAARAAGRRRAPPRRRQRAGSRRQSDRNSLGEFEDDPDSTSPTHRVKEEREPRQKLKLRPDPDKPEDIFLFNLREELLHIKGRGMWDKITERYNQQYEKKKCEALQMQLSRAVCRLAIWPEFEDKALIAALEEYDERRYFDIIKIMKEKGGCRAWNWRPEQVATRLVELGEEESHVSTKITRKRREELLRQRQNPNLWAQPSPPSALYDEQGLSVQTRGNLSAEEEEQLFTRLFVPESESETSDPDLMDTTESDPASGRTNVQRGLSEAHSGRVAKQACEQLLAQQHQASPYYNHQYSGQHHTS